MGLDGARSATRKELSMGLDGARSATRRWLECGTCATRVTRVTFDFQARDRFELHDKEFARNFQALFKCAAPSIWLQSYL